MNRDSFNTLALRHSLIIILSLFLSACAHGSNGSIHVSQPKVWREDAIMLSTGRQIAELRDFRKNIDLSKVQGTWSSSLSSSTTISAGKSATRPEIGNIPAAEATKHHVSDITNTTNVAEDPVDALQRVNDFGSQYEGMLLEHLRDSSSQIPGYSLYLLGFAVSVNPGPETQTGYDGYLKFNISTSNKSATNEGDIQVYAVSPERYAERFNQGFALDRELRAAAEATIQGAKVGAGHARQFINALSKFERYPIVSGFINGPRSFGWTFHARPTIARDGKSIEFALEPGIRHCYAILRVKDGSISAPKRFFRVDASKVQKKLDDKANGESWFRDLLGIYNGILSQADDGESEYIKTQLYRQAFGFSAAHEFQFDSVKKSFDSKAFETLHKAMLGLVGRQSIEGGVSSININVKGGWVLSDSGFFSLLKKTHLKFDEQLSVKTPSMVVEFPNVVDRTLESIWAVWPTSALEGEETWVSIKGQGFTNDPKVFIGDRQATEVQVVSSSTILAKFPPYTIGDGGTKPRCFRVKVYSGGEAMASPDKSFCYERTSAISFRITSVRPQEGKEEDKVKIVSNLPVLDKVDTVMIGSAKVTNKSVTADGRSMVIDVPKVPDKTTEGIVEIHLKFKKDTGIVPKDDYTAPFWFKHRK